MFARRAESAIAALLLSALLMLSVAVVVWWITPPPVDGERSTLPVATYVATPLTR